MRPPPSPQHRPPLPGQCCVRTRALRVDRLHVLDMEQNPKTTETTKNLLASDNDKQVETATEQCASIFDLRYDPKSKASKHTQKNLYPQILACIAAASFHLPVGIVVAYSAIIIPQLEKENSEIPVTKSQTAWIASLAVLVVPVGALITGFLVDKIGRLNTIRVACVPYMLGWVLIATAQDINMIYVGRFLTGFAIAMGPSPAIVYITEVARPDLRGSLICMGPSMTSLGMLIVYVKGALLNWRIVAWTGIGYCALPILAMQLWSPESPLWLCSKGKTEEALKSLQFLSRKDNQEGLAERQLASMQKECNSKKHGTTDVHILKKIVRGFSKPTGYKPLFILLMLFFFQQYAGIYITIFYAVTFFEEVKSGIDPYVSTILIGVIRMLVGLITSGLLRRYGRRTLCILSGLGISIVLSISGYFTWKIDKGEMTDSPVPVICMLLYMSLSVVGLMSIPWTMTAELFPMEIRGFAQGFIVSLAHVIMFSALQSYRTLHGYLGSYGIQWQFATVSFLSAIFVYVFLPETHRKMLYEIQDYFNHNTIYLLKNEKKGSKKTNNNENNVV